MTISELMEINGDYTNNPIEARAAGNVLDMVSANEADANDSILLQRLYDSCLTDDDGNSI